jgi:hypothetical protein
MLVQFNQDTPHTKREGSKKKFLQDHQYTLSPEYAKELIAAGACHEVIEITPEDLKPKRNKKS